MLTVTTLKAAESEIWPPVSLSAGEGTPQLHPAYALLLYFSELSGVRVLPPFLVTGDFKELLFCGLSLSIFQLAKM